MFSGKLNGIVRAARRNEIWLPLALETGPPTSPCRPRPVKRSACPIFSATRRSCSLLSKDGTAVCTKEACSFRDAYEVCPSRAEVIGVSSDSAKKHQAFASGHRLPFLLLSDAGGELRKAFGVPRTLGFLPGRVTYVIDKDGVVRHVFNSQFAADRHISEALAVVRQLAGS